MSARNGTAALGPEEMVRKENKVVGFLRTLLFVVLIVVGAALAICCYKLTAKSEMESYDKDFDVIASRFVDLFQHVMTQAMWNAYTIGVAISANTDAIKAAPNITVPLFEKLPVGALQTNYLNRVFWAPLINNETERKQWEAFTQPQLTEFETAAAKDVCYICGSADLEIGEPNALVELPIGTYACDSLAWAGFRGVVEKKDCPALVAYSFEPCQCRNKTDDGWKDRVSGVPAQIYEIIGNGTRPVQEGLGPYSPIWQVYPVGESHFFSMYDLASEPVTKNAIEAMVQTRRTVISAGLSKNDPNLLNTLFGFQADTWGNFMFSPVVSSDDLGNKVVGSVVFDLDWFFISGAIVPLGSQGVQIVIENSLGQQITLKSNGDNLVFVGVGDLHDPKYSMTLHQSTFDDYRTIQNVTSPYANGEISPLDCAYRIKVYASDEFRSLYITTKPRLYALVVMMIFVFTSLLFATYDCYVSRRQRKVMNAALQRDEIVTSLFPLAIQERLFHPTTATGTRPTNPWQKALHKIQSVANVKNLFLNADARHSANLQPRAAIADYFPVVSVVFADISGFTAWSSEREPSQVFDLLETVYQAFDKLVNRAGIFKVETIGDCYVAAAGVPCYQPDHAVRAVKFAYQCVLHMHELTRLLESSLGPSTLSLSIRVGVHSGPVIGGVLRNDKSRFQLFGDTMNTTARMQTTSEINMIHISSATARFLEEADKSSWIKPRSEPIRLKGKGLVQSFWADPLMSDEESPPGIIRDMSVGDESKPWAETRLSSLLIGKSSEADKIQRLVEWNTDLLTRFLQKLVSSRSVRTRKKQRGNESTSIERHHDSKPFDEVAEILSVEAFHDKSVKVDVDPHLIDLGENVRTQLFDYVQEIASMYRDIPFHNFEHASHVAMSAAKILMRIVKPDVVDSNNPQWSRTNKKGQRVALQRKVHSVTFGISSDMLLQFAAVLSAVVHDVDHTGLSNAQLVKERNDVAIQYNNKCVAEQNSVDIAWNLLMREQFQDLFRCICPTDDDQQRFRQLLVNAVIATDIADKELQQARKDRWDKAFPMREEANADTAPDCKDDMDRKATVVYEYIIQASDVAHTMQHWKVYKQWNERLFEECYLAYVKRKDERDPSISWYQEEIWFFDNYIIPLAKKLETCGVFGVSSDEYLSHALENRHEWELKGEDIVKCMVEKCKECSEDEEE